MNDIEVEVYDVNYIPDYVEHEEQRQANELIRIANENTRQTNESTRQSNETSRTSAESTRTSNELNRISAENQRIINENARIAAEEEREELIDSLATVATTGKYSDLIDEPTKVSDFTNDSGFITNQVNNLANYYKKNETYNKTEVNGLLNDKADATTTQNQISSINSTLETKANTSDVASTYETITNHNNDMATQSARITNNETEIATLQSRMDTFANLDEGSTTGDAELQDIRTDFTGQAYSTAGNSTRWQAKFLNNKIDDLETYFKNHYEEGILANGSIQNPGNSKEVHTTNFIPINGGEYIEINIKDFPLQENEVFIYGWSLFNASKTAIQHNGTSKDNTSNIIQVSGGSAIKYCDVVIGVWNTSTLTERTIRKTDFAPYQVQLKTTGKYFESLENSVNTKYNKNNVATQIYLNEDNLNLNFEKSGNDVYIKFNTAILIRGGYFDNTLNYSSILESLDSTYKGTSPAGIENCIKIPDSYNMVFDTQEAPRIKIISRNNIDANRYIELIDVVSGIIKKGVLKHYFDYLQINDKITQLQDVTGIYPSYWNNKVASVVDKVRTNIANLDNKLESFFFITDQHWISNAQKSSDLIKYLGNKLQIPLVLSGGDVLNANVSTKLRAISEISDYVASLDNGYIRLFGTYGNHDNNNNINLNPGNALTTQQIYNAMLKQRESFTFDSPNIKVMKYDNTNSHIRYISFKCSWEYGETIDNDMINQVLSYISELDSTWNVVLFCHTYWVDNNTQIYSTAANYVDKIATLEKTCDANIVALFVGHVHNDYYTTYSASNGGKLLIISTTTDSFRQNNAAQNPPYTMTEGTDTEQAFDIVQIDTGSKHIYLTRVGAGNDRDFAY